MVDWRVRTGSLYQQLVGTEGPIPSSPVLSDAGWMEWETTGVTSTALTSMVLDGMLDLDWGEGPRSGSDGAPALMSNWQPPNAQHPLAEQSFLALRLASQLPFSSPADTSRWLYGFGMTPNSPQDMMINRRKCGLIWSVDREKLGKFYLHGHNTVWEIWSRRDKPNQKAPLHKLYVSPAGSSLDDIIHETAILLCEKLVDAFKIVVDRQASNRPDKFIIYFGSPGERDQWADLLAQRIVGCTGHGVPFTDQVGDMIALSAATDPDLSETCGQVASWRSWCTDRLGWSLSIGQFSRQTKFAPWEIALFRLSLERVDLSRWRQTQESTNQGDSSYE